MPFESFDIDQYIEEKRQNDHSFKKAWDESREEYRLVSEMTEIRKSRNLTQKQLAKKIGKKQQMISRIENHEVSPSLKSFCVILDTLGYQLKIERKPEC